MGAFDDIRDKAEDAMDNLSPEQQQKIEQIAQDKGIPFEQAREHFFNSQDNDRQSGDQNRDMPQASERENDDLDNNEDMRENRDMDEERNL